MNKNFVKAVGFFALCVFSYYLIAYLSYPETLARKLSPVSQVKQHNEFWNDSEIYDWVVLGSSHAYRGLDPKLFESKGLKFFNLGSSSQTPVNSLEILRKLPGKTRGVILDIYSVTFNLSGRESFYDLLSSGYSAQILAPMWFQVANARSLQLLLSKPLIDIKNEKTVPNEMSYKGYVSSNAQASAETKYTKYSLYHKENLEKQWKAFEEILQVAKANNLKLVLVMAPLPKALVIEGEAEFIKRLSEVIKPFSVVLVDASRSHSLDDYRDFFDSDHLNSQGVQWWNQKILESYNF